MNLTLLFILFVSSFNDYLVSSFTSSSVPASQRIEWRKRTDVDGELNSSPTIWLHKCRTMETLVEMSKDELGTNGELIRRCHGQALVSKCEGACISNLRPSIQTPTGLLKVLSLKVLLLKNKILSMASANKLISIFFFIVVHMKFNNLGMQLLP